MAITIEDFIILPMCAYFGNVGVSLTGFGMAILYVLVWQIASMLGYAGDLKYAIFIQAVALMSTQPISLYRTDVRKYANRRILANFIPVTIIATPLGQWTSEHVPTITIQRVAGVLVTLLALWEVYQHRDICCGRQGAAAGHEQQLEINPDGTDGSYNRAVEETGETKGRRSFDVERPIEKSRYNPHGSRKSTKNPFKSNSKHSKSRHSKNSERGSSSEDTTASENDIQGGELTVVRMPQMRDVGTQTIQEDMDPLVDPTRESTWLERFFDGPDGDTVNRTKISFEAQCQTLFAGATSGFLGGLCGIRGPPIIAYFLHPPIPFDKHTQRATALCISFVNVTMRMAYYVADVVIFKKESFIVASDWGLYVAVVVASVVGCLVGSELFEMVKDSRDMIRAILSLFLLLCGFSLLVSSFVSL